MQLVHVDFLHNLPLYSHVLCQESLRPVLELLLHTEPRVRRKEHLLFLLELGQEINQVALACL